MKCCLNWLNASAFIDIGLPLAFHPHEGYTGSDGITNTTKSHSHGLRSIYSENTRNNVF